MITFHSTSIMDTDAEALVNTVNCVGVMGKGLAKAVKERWLSVYHAYLKDFRDHRLCLGSCRVAATNQSVPRVVVNFPTKMDWRNPSKLEWIEWGLLSLRRAVRDGGFRSAAVPALGCANGQLNYRDVLPRILATAETVPEVDWRIYLPEAAADCEAHHMVKVDHPPKRRCAHCRTRACRYCGEPIEMSQARHDGGLGDACFGCAGYPFCSCDRSHQGDCPTA